jgi:hypothetical protein
MHPPIPHITEWLARVAEEEAAGIQYVPPFTADELRAFRESHGRGLTAEELDTVGLTRAAA